MSDTNKILKILRESISFHYLEDASTENLWVVLSLAGHGFRIHNKPSFKEVMAEFEIHLPAQVLSLYTYGQMVDACGRLGACLTAPRPADGSVSKILLRKTISHRMLNDLGDLETELNTFCFAIECIEKYLGRLDDQSELPNVDVSMWTGVDINFTDIDKMVERKSIQYSDWDEFAETIFALDLPEEHREKLVQIIYACKEFEEANPHLVLQEVIDPLLILLEELEDRPAPKTFEVN